ncbi:hemolysin III family protein [bacterium]|nr:hemolysin III family protein [bacterium]
MDGHERSSLCETPAEEVASSATHGIGAALSIFALMLMIVRAEGILETTAAAIFGTSLVTLYLTSTLYHLFTRTRIKEFFQLLDHSCIYLLIAGTYTPVTLVTLGGGWGWSLFGIVWGLALAGIIFKAATHGKNDHWISTAVYIAMGWLVVIALKPLLQAIEMTGFIMLAAGGLCYTLGVIFFVWEKMHFNHAIWHLFVMGGSACHVIAVIGYVI